MVAAVGAAAVLGTQRDRPSAGSPSRSESAWVDAWGRWHERLLEDVGVAESLVLAEPARFLAAVAPLGACAGFDRIPDPPPRYAAAARKSREVCGVAATMPGLARRLVKGDTTASADFALANDRIGVLAAETEEALRSKLSFNRPLPVQTGHTLSSRIEPRLGRAATVLAGRPVQARCWSPMDWGVVVGELHAFYGEPRDHDLAGFAEPAVTREARIHLAPDVCAALGLSHPSAGRQLAFAVDALAHESEHVFSPSGSEAETECAAVQHIPRAAALLGFGRVGRRLADLYWRGLYEGNPSAYRTPLCREDGPLDETPGDGVWP